MKQKLLQLWVYFRQGHAVYLIFALSFLNFMVIQWRLSIEKVEMLGRIFSNFFIFVGFFLLTYIPLAVFLGWWDFRRGSVGVRASEHAKVSPYHKDMAQAVKFLAQGKKKEADEILEKWCK